VTRYAGRVGWAAVAVLAAFAALLGAAGVRPGHAEAALPGASVRLTRAPYLTDVTTDSVRVTWATATAASGTVRFGQPGACTVNASTAVSGARITVNGTAEYQYSVRLTGLAATRTYCYRIFAGPTDLLGTNPSPRFTTLDPPAAGTGFTFVVLGDWGSTTAADGTNTGALNVNQAALAAAIAHSGARFAVTTGDIAYPAGSQTNYGDLSQTGPDISAVFAPSYWTLAGQGVPLFTVPGNHGRTSTLLSVWPESTVVARSGGRYAMLAYPSIDGSVPASYPTSYYAFTTGGVRFYLLDASWSDNNTGSATGGACGANCRKYEVDRDAHWTTSSAEYQWLAQDLATHPGVAKLAFFHFPLRSDNPTESSDLYLQNLPTNPNSLEKLLYDGGVRLVFNGHSHTYQRFVAPPGGVASYVSGGGGERLEPVAPCTVTDAYAIGWSYSSSRGSVCGAAQVPTSISQVFHFLRVTVSGATITVAPTNAAGATFDVMTYSLAARTAASAARRRR
jgi:hypothetical protein